MTKENFLNIIKKWNIDHPYDKAWRSRYKVSLFSPEHKAMCPVDMVLEIEEHRLYQEMEDELQKQKESEDEHFVRTVKVGSATDGPYIPGEGNFMSHPEDSLSEKEKDDLFESIDISSLK